MNNPKNPNPEKRTYRRNVGTAVTDNTAKNTVKAPPRAAKRTESDKTRKVVKVKNGELLQNSDIPNIVRYKGSIDRGFLALVLILISFGSVMVFSASYAYSMSQDPGNGFIYIKRQILYVAVGLLAMFLISRFDTETIRKLAPICYWVTIVLLILVLVIGFVGGGAKRWIRIAGFSVQPSEIAKVTLAMMIAVHMDKYYKQINDDPSRKTRLVYGIGWPLFYIALVCGLVAAEKHLSGTIILFLIGVVVIWAGGADKTVLLSCGIGGAALLGTVAMLVPYTRRRITTMFNLEADPTGASWQTRQGLLAIGSGGLTGLGPTNSRQKHMYVSQPQNDFIFSILCEELGYIGAMAVIALFIALIIKGYKIAMKAPDMFTSLVVTGIVSKVGIQAAFNIGVVTNTLPNTGISLPFFSYGGSSTIVLLAEMGIILAISRYSRQDR